MNKVCILGSINMDLVVNINDIPQIGETILAKNLVKIPGGKGANQAIAAARSGAEVFMIGKVGKDENGIILKDKLKEDNVDVKYVEEGISDSTGIAFIMVNKDGNNSIVVVSGANGTIEEMVVNKSIDYIEKSDILLSQFETPENVTLKFFEEGKRRGKVTILNPAPAKEISDELLKVTDIIIPNETEVEILTGIKVFDLDSAKQAAEILIDKGVKICIITLGEKGAAVIGNDFASLEKAYKVNAVDTTAAGDSFIGALSSVLDCSDFNKNNLCQAVRFGNKVSSITVQRKGAQPSIPYLKEINEIYEKK